MRLKECIDTFGEESFKCGSENTGEKDKSISFNNYILRELDYPYRLLYLNYRLNYLLESQIGAMAQGYQPDLIIVIIEEAKSLLSDPSNRFFFNRLEATRGARIGMWFITQTSEIQKDALNACSLKIIGKLDYNECSKLAPSLRMNPRQIKWAEDNLQQKYFIARTDNGPYTKPFIIKSDEIELVKPQLIKPIEQKQDSPIVLPTQTKNIEIPKDIGPSPLTAIEMEYLKLLATIWPALPITGYDHFVEMNDLVGIGRSTGDRIRKKFLTNGKWKRF